MKKHFLITAIFIFCLSASGYGQTSTITGYVFNDKGKAEPGIVVIINARRGTADKDGKFTIEFKSPIKSGTPITVSVEDQGWAVLAPFMGEDQIENEELNSNPLHIIIAPVKSPLFLVPTELIKLTEAMQVEAMQVAAAKVPFEKNSRSQIEAAREREKTKVLEAYAKLSGFEVDTIRSAQRELSKIMESLEDREKAAVAYSNKEFARSGGLYLEVARNKAAREKAKKDLQKSNEDTINYYIRAGEGYIEAFQYREALVPFEELEKEYFETGEISKESFKHQWLGLKLFIGRTKGQLSYLAKQDEAIKLLKDGIDDFTQALNSTTQDQFLAERSQLQFGLGSALADLGNRSNSNDSISSLNLAIVAFNEAISSGEQLQRIGNSEIDLYTPQISLGRVWTQLGEKTGGKESADNLNKALDAFDKADKLIKYDDPFGRASLKSSLGQAFSDLAIRTNDPAKSVEYLDKAVAAYNEALGTYGALPDSNQVQCSPCAGSALVGLGIAQTLLGERTSDLTKSVDILNKALDAFDKADKIINRGTDPLSWASLKSNLGETLSDLAIRTNDPAKSVEYLDKAVAAYGEAYTIDNQGPCSPCTGSTLIGLGIAQTQLGEREGDSTKSVEYFNKALDAFDKADKIINRGTDSFNWASLKSNLGETLSDLAIRTNDPAKSVEYLNKAVAAYNESADTYSLLQNTQGWANARVSLAGVYFSLKNWAGVLEVCNSVLQAFPDDYRAHGIKLGVLHDSLFKFEEAFTLNKEWLERHPDDLSAQFDQAENNFTTGRFAESIQLINTLLTNRNITIDVKIALQAIEIGCLLATNRSKEVMAKLDTLIAEVSDQSSDFRVNWIFDGTRQFIRQNEKLSPYQIWMETLFGALDPRLDHEEMIKALKEVKANFKN